MMGVRYVSDLLEGTLVKGVGGLYYARTQTGDIHVLRAKGIFRKKGTPPLVGDCIQFTPSVGEEHGWVESILPRQNQLVRPAVANIAHIVMVIAPAPAPDFLLLDTLLVMAYQQNIAPVIVVNKCDLDSQLFHTVQHDYASLHIPVLQTSTVTGEGISDLQTLLLKGIVCFAGQSGVGKSTLLSASTGLVLETGEISRKIQRGRHTTRHAELLVKDGYQVLDTPGFSLLSLWEGLNPVHLKNYYPDFFPYEGQCKFSPCYHKNEPQCAVLTACAEGEISPNRLMRYHQLLDKAQEAWRKRYD